MSRRQHVVKSDPEIKVLRPQIDEVRIYANMAGKHESEWEIESVTRRFDVRTVGG